MARWMKNTCLILALAATLFCSIGYAALSDTLQITGQVQVEPPNAVFIVEIKNVTSSNVNFVGSDAGKPTNISFPSTKFVSNVQFTKDGASITFDVKIVNGTSEDRIFDTVKAYESMEGVEGTFSASYVTPSIINLATGKEYAKGTVLPKGESVTCRVTLTYDIPAYWSDTGSRKMLHEIRFVKTSDELTQEATNKLLIRFAAILNDNEKHRLPNQNNTSQTFNETYYEYLKRYMNTGQSGQPDYIANNSGAEVSDQNVIKEVFGTENLVLDNGAGEEVKVTVLVKELELWSGSEANQKERCLYITADDLQDAGGQAPVYVVVFAKPNKAGSQWAHVGGVILEGHATVIDYTGNNGKGNFQTADWRSYEKYFEVEKEATLETIIGAFFNQNPNWGK